jgi:hypothetical protein
MLDVYQLTSHFYVNILILIVDTADGPLLQKYFVKTTIECVAFTDGFYNNFFIRVTMGCLKVYKQLCLTIILLISEL